MAAWALFWLLWLPMAALLGGAAGVAWRLWRGAARPGFGELPRMKRGAGLAEAPRALRLLAWLGLFTASPLAWLARRLLGLGLILLFLRHLGLIWPALIFTDAWWTPVLASGGPLAAAAAYALLLRRLATPILRRPARAGAYLWPIFSLIVLASGLVLTRLAGPAWPVAADAAPGPALGLHLALGWLCVALWPWSRWGQELERLTGRLARRPAPAPAAELQPPDWEIWSPAAYHAWLMLRWSKLGVHQVLGAGQRNRSLPLPPRRDGEGGHAR